MKNPIVTAREHIGLSQRELAELLGVSQQFIQRHEVGMASQLPGVIYDYLDSRFSYNSRLDFLADLLVDAAEHKPSLTAAIPEWYFPGSSNFQQAHASFHYLYRLWIRLERAALPSMAEYLHLQSRSEIMAGLCKSLGLSNDTDNRIELAKKLHIHTYVVYYFFRDTTMSNHISRIPEPIITALQETGVR